MNSFVQSTIQSIIGCFKNLDAAVIKIISLLTLDFTGNSMYQIAKEMNGIISTFALTIASIVFMAEMIKLILTFETRRKELFYQFLLKVIITKNISDISGPFLLAIYAKSVEMVQKISFTQRSLSDAAIVVLTNQTKNIGFWDVMAVNTTASIASIGIRIVAIIITAIAYGRLFELFVYYSVSPLPFSFILMDQSRITKRFVFSFAAICLQGVIILVAIKLYYALCADQFITIVKGSSNPSELLYNMFMASVVLLIAIVQSSQTAKTTLDA